MARGDCTDPAGQSADVHFSKARRGGTVTELTVAVEPPALDPAAGGPGTGVQAACGDGADPAGQATDILRGQAIRVEPIPELAVEVVAPALDPAAGGQGTGVEAACGDGADPAGQSANVHRSQTLGGGAVTELAAGVSAPALDPSVGGDSAAVAATSGNPGDVVQRCLGVRRGVVSR